MHEALSRAWESRQVLPKHDFLLRWLEEKLVASLQICCLFEDFCYSHGNNSDTFLQEPWEKLLLGVPCPCKQPILSAKGLKEAWN